MRRLASNACVGQGDGMLYKLFIAACLLAIAVNLAVLGFFASARYNTPLLLLMTAVNLWHFRRR